MMDETSNTKYIRTEDGGVARPTLDPSSIGAWVRVLGWGWDVRQHDCGSTGPIVKINRLTVTVRLGDRDVRARPEQVGLIVEVD